MLLLSPVLQRNDYPETFMGQVQVIRQSSPIKRPRSEQLPGLLLIYYNIVHMTKKYTLLGLLTVVVIISYFLHVKSNRDALDSSQAAKSTDVEYFDTDNSVVTISEASNEAIKFSGLGYDTVDLKRVVSASGEKFENPGGTMIVWMKGEEVSVYDGNELVFVGTDNPHENITPEGTGDSEAISDETDSLTVLKSFSWNWISTTNDDGTDILPVKDGAFTLLFDNNGTVRGTTDCNSFYGDYKTTDQSILFTPFATTRMACEDSQEADFISAIADAKDFSFDAEGNLALIQGDNKNTTLLQRVELE